MKKIGITGSLASGKTTASKIISAKKGPLFNADYVVKKIYAKKSFQQLISKKFNLSNNSNLKKNLKKKILENKKNLIILEKLIHPKVRKEMKKLKLKEDEKGNKVTDVRGIRAACKVMKTRYAKPFEGVQVKIPYDTGMDPYSGLVDLFEKKGVLTQQGNRLKYIDSAGKEHIEFRKAWVGDKLDMLMQDFDKLSIDQPKEE